MVNSMPRVTGMRVGAKGHDYISKDEDQKPLKAPASNEGGICKKKGLFKGKAISIY
jgi:hypothetical protein